jgi:hypothetical protein
MDAGVLLYWVPLGAGGRVVALNGRLYEAVCARREHRPRRPLFHAALEIRLAGWGHAVEMAPAWGNPAGDRGVVATGPVGLRPLGRSRYFRYEVRAWRGGSIPDASYAVDSPVVVSADRDRATAVLDLVPQVPALTWGRDELGAGEMWNSNSLVAWLLAGTGHQVTDLHPPSGGRAPGWRSGLVLATGGA